MKKHNLVTQKFSIKNLQASKSNVHLISPQAQNQVKGGTADSIIIEEDMVI